MAKKEIFNLKKRIVLEILIGIIILLFFSQYKYKILSRDRLVVAVEQNGVKRLHFLVKFKLVNQDMLDEALVDTCLYDDYDMFKFLLDNGANPKTTIKSQGFTLTEAASLHSTEKILNLLNLEGIKKDYNEILYWAVYNNNFKDVKEAISKGADANNSLGRDESLLNFALKNKNKEMAQYLIDNGANVNWKGQSGETILFIQTRYGNVEMIKLLIDNGANVNVDVNGTNSFQLALDSGSTEMIKLFIKAGAKTVEGKKLSLGDISLNGLENIDFILESKEKFTNDEINEFLVRIVEENRTELMEKLIKSKLDLNMSKDKGQNLIVTAYNNKSIEMLKLILANNKRFNISEIDKEAMTKYIK
ncbi:MAG: ankyrin repeat domain-containing protein [Fusobacteriaceae bacterium]|nr:ankyrin repeat domain-containing protein [Fusobacteriaceae bacterium]